MRLTRLRIMLGLLASCAAMEATAAVLDDPQYAQARRAVSVGEGRRMNIDCRGSGSPTVVLESGLADATMVWGLVQPELSKSLRVCAYDRAGIGFSDGAVRPSDSASIVADLHALLRAAGVKPPYVLVGHSFGGLNARLYAATFPDEVRAMVLVDPSHEDQAERYAAAEGRVDPGVMGQVARSRACATAPATPGCGPDRDPRFGPRLDAARQAMGARDAYRKAAASEVENFRLGVDGAQVRGANRSLGDKPLIVLTKTLDQKFKPIDQASPRARAWWAMHEDIAALSSRGVHVSVPNASHYIQLDQPQAVIDAIRQVADQVQGRR